MVALDHSIRMISLQFSFSNPKLVPESIQRLEHETLQKRTEREGAIPGQLMIKPVMGCSISRVVDELEASGYILADALYKPRIVHNRAKKTYHMVRFLFVRQEFAEISDFFRAKREDILHDLAIICRDAMWRVRCYKNHFFLRGEMIKGQYFLSINLEARQPLFLPDGQPVRVWQKDEDGQRIGEAPQPVKPAFILRADLNLRLEKGSQ